MHQANLNSEWLRTFVTVVETEGFIRAGEHLHKTQSTVSQQIRRLEQEVGTDLFVAEGRRKVLTPSGEILLGYARRMLALQDDALFAVRQTAIHEELKIGVSSGLSDGLFPQMLGRFCRAYPDVRLFVETGYSGEITQRFDRGDFDLALTLEREPTQGDVLTTEDLVWIGAEGFQWNVAARSLPLASFSDPCQFRATSISALNQVGIPWQMVFATSSLPSLMSAVKAGLAVTVRARHAVSEGTEIVGPRLGLPPLPKISVVLRNRGAGQAGALLGTLFRGAELKVA